MDALTCPRCHAPLNGQANFCPECGAPQLTVETPEPASGTDAGSGDDGLSDSVAAANTGAHAQVAWPAAITAAGLLALPAGLLSSLLSFSTLWVVAGGAWTTVLYRRRTAGSLSTSLGSRIGCVFGVFAALIATLADAISLLVRRYGLHHGAEIDTQLRIAMQDGINRVLVSNPDAAHQIPWFFHFWLSPDGQAGLVLASAIISATSMLGFAALGGALGARYIGLRRS